METPNVIIVLAAGVKQNASSRWVSTDLTPEDNAIGAPGGKLRVLAAAVLADRHPEAVIVASGGRGDDIPNNAPHNRPLLAEVLRDELVEHGVSAGRIILEKESNNTFQQLAALAALIHKRGWTRVTVVTNRWHVPRTHAIIERKFSKLESIVTLVSAEEVLIANNSDEWESDIVQAYASEWLARRIDAENRGIQQIREGKYNFK